MPKISVIIPTYNPGRFLRETLESVHAQTFGDWECFVIDDSSTEDLSWITRDFPRCHLIRQPRGGASVARNRGILLSRAPYIAFLDHDDLWRPHHLEYAAAALDAHPSAALYHDDLAFIDENSRLMDRQTLPPEDVAPACEVALQGDQPPDSQESRLLQSVRYFSQAFIVPATVVVRREALGVSGLMDPLIPFSGDFDMIIKLGAQFQVLHLPLIQTLYRRHSGSFTYQYDAGRRELNTVIARYRAFARTQGDKLLARQARALFRRPRRLYAAQAFECARSGYRRKMYGQLLYHLFRACCFSPGFVLASLARFRPKPAGAAARRER